MRASLDISLLVRDPLCWVDGVSSDLRVVSDITLLFTFDILGNPSK